ncbi:MAG: hypothetical protein M9962_08620 [Oligoflexia bacterium]|nr:hypothetical protein [Oligoflexia bacterium]
MKALFILSLGTLLLAACSSGDDSFTSSAPNSGQQAGSAGKSEAEKEVEMAYEDYTNHLLELNRKGCRIEKCEGEDLQSVGYQYGLLDIIVMNAASLIDQENKIANLSVTQKWKIEEAKKNFSAYQTLLKIKKSKFQELQKLQKSTEALIQEKKASLDALIEQEGCVTENPVNFLPKCGTLSEKVQSVSDLIQLEKLTRLSFAYYELYLTKAFYEKISNGEQSQNYKAIEEIQNSYYRYYSTNLSIFSHFGSAVANEYRSSLVKSKKVSFVKIENKEFSGSPKEIIAQVEKINKQADQSALILEKLSDLLTQTALDKLVLGAKENKKYKDSAFEYHPSNKNALVVYISENSRLEDVKELLISLPTKKSDQWKKRELNLKAWNDALQSELPVREPEANEAIAIYILSSKEGRERLILSNKIEDAIALIDDMKNLRSRLNEKIELYLDINEKVDTQNARIVFCLAKECEQFSPFAMPKKTLLLSQDADQHPDTPIADKYLTSSVYWFLKSLQK